MSNFLLKLGLHFQTVSVLIKLMITIGLFILLHLLNKSIFHFIDKINLTSQQTIKNKKILSVINKIIFVLLIVPVWIYESKDILTFLGLFSAGLAFAFKDLVSNFLGWVIINSHKPFQVGDRIKIEDSIGDVLEIDWFHTTIIEVTQTNKTYGQSTGRLVYIPNIKALSFEIINETNTFPYTWNELEITLTLDSNWQKAKNLIMSITEHHLGNIEEEAKLSLDIASKTHPIYYQNLSHTIYTSIDIGKIILTLRFICRSRNFRNLEHNITESILIEFEKHNDINLL
ncbi:mechanosensitive ion channel family protein [Clostridium sp. ZS2-4]|uniref:mechanosensitive ion channel family protein n=1 Tax=Clostridium sp. ZS2-4 TaxID=2987703 RepID=UPI00227A0940|nr:mechanosensitive ion channel domain-containing protein [Clostridium sp. ZS2-4]MCY6356521.1 mechanosensitive ion channel [Clostridium sp. ZS2-4]